MAFIFEVSGDSEAYSETTGVVHVDGDDSESCSYGSWGTLCSNWSSDKGDDNNDGDDDDDKLDDNCSDYDEDDDAIFVDNCDDGNEDDDEDNKSTCHTAVYFCSNQEEAKDEGGVTVMGREMDDRHFWEACLQNRC